FRQSQNRGGHPAVPPRWDPLRNPRPLSVPAWVRWLMWNMPYHAAHHTFPGVPFHALPRLHHEIEDGLGQKLPSAGYFAAQAAILRMLWRGREPLEPVA